MRPSASVMMPKSVPQISSFFIRGTFELGPVSGQTIPTLTSLIIGASGCACPGPPMKALKSAIEYFWRTGLREPIACVRQRSTFRIYGKCENGISIHNTERSQSAQRQTKCPFYRFRRRRLHSNIRWAIRIKDRWIIVFVEEIQERVESLRPD